MALKCADVVVTEAGFGADLGAEKFLDIKCQEAKLKPDLVVMVATIRALKMHGGQALEELATPNVAALKKGMANLERHLSNIKKFGLKVVVAVNHFASDDQEEIDYILGWCERHHYECAFLDGFLKGGKGSEELARLVKEKLSKGPSRYHAIYNRSQPIKEKILRICKDIYRADDVEFSALAEEQIAKFESMGYVDTYICMAKTPNSFTDDPSVLNAPRGFNIHVKEVRLSAGANFLVCLTGTILTLPGLPKVPQAVKMEDN